MPQTERDIAGRQQQISDAKLRKILSEQARPTIVIKTREEEEEEEDKEDAEAGEEKAEAEDEDEEVEINA